MFREAFERGAEVGAGPIARLWRQALVLASRNWQLESLYRSNAKYQPEWQPRFICFEYTSDLPRVGTAAGSAEGFLTRPSLSAAEPARHGRSRCAGPRRRRLRGRGRGADPGGTGRGLAEAMSAHRLPEQVAGPSREAGPAAGPRHRPVPGRPTRGPTRSRRSARRPASSHRTPRPDVRSRWSGGSSASGTAASSGSRTLRDGSGDLQVMVGCATSVSAADLDLWRHDVDLGDHVGVTGEVITTQARRAVRPRRVAAAHQQVAAAAARQAQGPDRPRGPRPRPLRRPDRPAGRARHRLHARRRWCAASATRCTPAGSPRWRRRCCS